MLILFFAKWVAVGLGGRVICSWESQYLLCFIVSGGRAGLEFGSNFGGKKYYFSIIRRHFFCHHAPASFV